MKSRVKPHQLAIALGAVFATITLVSGITATVAQWHDDSDVQREVFGNIPGVWKLVFYTVLPVLILYGSVLFSQRVRNWERGAPDKRRDHHEERRSPPEGLPGRRLHADPAARSRRRGHAQPHLLLVPDPARRHDGAGDQPPAARSRPSSSTATCTAPTAAIGDGAGLMLLVGVLWAIVRRYVQRPYRIRIKSKPEHAIILGTLLAIAVTGFGAEVWRIALQGRPVLRAVVVRRLPARRA